MPNIWKKCRPSFKIRLGLIYLDSEKQGKNYLWNEKKVRIQRILPTTSPWWNKTRKREFWFWQMYAYVCVCWMQIRTDFPDDLVQYWMSAMTSALKNEDWCKLASVSPLFAYAFLSIATFSHLIHLSNDQVINFKIQNFSSIKSTIF